MEFSYLGAQAYVSLHGSLASTSYLRISLPDTVVGDFWQSDFLLGEFTTQTETFHEDLEWPRHGDREAVRESPQRLKSPTPA